MTDTIVFVYHHYYYHYYCCTIIIIIVAVLVFIPIQFVSMSAFTETSSSVKSVWPWRESWKRQRSPSDGGTEEVMVHKKAQIIPCALNITRLRNEAIQSKDFDLLSEFTINES